ncbi:dicarboxylate symporter family protein [Anaplasma phagocytophilum str. CRT53-1]|uniref:Dicarboxylate symporter family protein n=1 Tax=Anaplasma phagocytophilum str. CRT53-1 TaxID=1359157 RepID=A0A0F3Q244_ANAPH|nr:cation:dicarboxylase symporter family transporter [Anaplasma phagocytophilum]KJV86685.1 dicarboxylate symporter family protein [Anaplasma phagocytophilum str. CRT53-1]
MLKFFLIFLAVGFAFLTKYLDIPVLLEAAQGVSSMFIGLLKLVGIPMIFLSVMSTFSGLSGLKDAKSLIGSTIFYALATTTVAALIGLCLYIVIAPAQGINISEVSDSSSVMDWDYGAHLMSVFPDNFVRIFLDNNVIGCIGVSFLLGAGCLFIEDEQRAFMSKFFSAMFEVFLRAAGFLTYLMPLAVWGFMTVFLCMPQGQDFSNGLTKYVLCVMLANAIQAVIVLPGLLMAKGIPVIPTLKAVLPSLVTAFFSRSSVVALPVTIKCVNEGLGESKRVTSFVLPLCASINMNACASFILITVLFVCEVNLHSFSFMEILIWVIFAIGGAVGNAGVPMGCYFMVMSYLTYMKVPLHVMGLILPMYSILDMFETALNVWSDICVTRVIGRKHQAVSS